VNSSLDAEKEKAAANDPKLRMFHVPNTVADEPQKDVMKKAADTAWLETTPQNVGNFTAAGYFFGRELRKQLDVPIGLINTSWGGTRAEAWTSKPALEAVPTCKAIITGWDEFLKTYDSAKMKEAHEKGMKAQLERVAKIKEENAKPGAEQKPVPPVRGFEDLRTSQHRPAVLFNAMIAPLVPYTAKGAIWYQGESNQRRAVQYETLLPTMIKDWRTHWGDKDLSFYIVQLASFGNSKPSWPQPVGADDTWAELQWAQFVAAAKTPKCGLAVANDIGEEKDIHPKNKQEVGRRLALQALVKDYKKTGMLSGGPIFAGGDKVAGRYVINFSNGVGLKARDGGEIKGFIICGEDKVWKPAKATVSPGRPTLNVSSPEVKNPVAVRYAWASWCPEANLVNKDGLPTSCFRTDKFDLSTKGVEDPFKEALPAAPKPAAEPKKEEIKPAINPEGASAKKAA
jgi:sialate O-acetylesterase